jgi:hypothetical protein
MKQTNPSVADPVGAINPVFGPVPDFCNATSVQSLPAASDLSAGAVVYCNAVIVLMAALFLVLFI